MVDQELQTHTDNTETQVHDTHTVVLQSRGGIEESTILQPQRDRSHVKEVIVAVLGTCIVTGAVVITTVLGFEKEQKVEPTVEQIEVVQKIQESVPMPPEEPNPYTSLSIQGKSAIVYDVFADKVLYGKNEKERLPLASLTKLMTSLLAVESLEAESAVAVSPHALETEGDSGLLANESWNVLDLVGFTMVTSSNDGADALAAAVGSLWSTPDTTVSEQEKVDFFIDRMNTRAQELGLLNTRYMNATGLDVPDGGGRGTAEDVSKLLTYIWGNEPDVIRFTNEYGKNFISKDGFAHYAENTNENVFRIPGLLGGKTGYTDLAGGNLAVIYDAGLNHPIVVVVLGSTKEGRFTDVQKLVDATYAYENSGWAEYDRVAGSTATVKGGE